MSSHGWTVEEACRQFAMAGMPVDRKGFQAMVTAACRLGHLERTGETRSGANGGRGYARYEIAGLQRLHKDVAPWLAVPQAEPADRVVFDIGR